jgi:excisionase family DNA binding protein
MNTNEILTNRQFTVVMYDLKETASILGVTTRTVLNYIYEDKLKGQKIGGKWKISKENLEKFCNGN